jgi:hypothetical protein
LVLGFITFALIAGGEIALIAGGEIMIYRFPLAFSRFGGPDFGGVILVVGNVLIGLISMILGRCLGKALDRAFAKQFAGAYHTHGITAYPLGVREKYLRYALFLQGLSTQGRSRDDIARLKRFAETLAPPPRPAFRLSQNAVYTILVALLVGCVLDWFKQPEAWRQQSWRWVIGFILAYSLLVVIVLHMLFLVSQVVPTWRDRYRREILSFLQWAEEDMPDKNLTKNNELTC